MAGSQGSAYSASTIVRHEMPIQSNNPMLVLRRVVASGFINSAQFNLLCSWTLPVMMLIHGIFIGAAYAGYGLTYNEKAPPRSRENLWTTNYGSAIAFTMAAAAYAVSHVLATSYLIWKHRSYPLIKAKGNDFAVGMSASTILSVLFVTFSMLTAHVPKLYYLPNTWLLCLCYSLSALFYTSIIAMMAAKQKLLYTIFYSTTKVESCKSNLNSNRGLFADPIYMILMTLAVIMVLYELGVCFSHFKFHEEIELVIPMLPVLVALIILCFYAFKTKVVHEAFNDSGRNIWVCMVLSILIVVVCSDLLYNHLHQSKMNGNGFYKSFAYFVSIYMYLIAYSEHFVVIAFLAMKGISLRTELSPTNTVHYDVNCIGNYVSRGGSLVLSSQSTLVSTHSIASSKRKDRLSVTLPACAEFIENSEESGRIYEDNPSSTKRRKSSTTSS